MFPGKSSYCLTHSQFEVFLCAQHIPFTLNGIMTEMGQTPVGEKLGTKKGKKIWRERCGEKNGLFKKWVCFRR